MKLTRIVLISASLLGMTMPGWTQTINRLGHFGQRPIPHKAVVPSEGEAAAVTYTGKFVFNFTITIESTIPTSDTIYCNAEASVFDNSDAIYLVETASVTATRSGSTATCSVTIPYSWTLLTPSSDSVSPSYTIYALPSGSAPLATRESEHELPGTPVPANGATTTETIKAVI